MLYTSAAVLSDLLLYIKRLPPFQRKSCSILTNRDVVNVAQNNDLKTPQQYNNAQFF